MSQVFILQNQEHYFFSKQGDWVDGRDAKVLFRTPHKDEAVNQSVEITAKDYTQRIQLRECTLNDKGLPELVNVELPPPLPDSTQEPSEPEIDILTLDAASPESTRSAVEDTSDTASTGATWQPHSV